jgi:hypothetical protein
MNDDLLKLLVLLGVVFFIIGLGMNVLKQNMNKREGLANQTSSGGNGEAGNANNFVATIKAQTVLLQDSLLISKYRTDYENVVINMEDYLNILMLKQVLNIDTTKDAQANMSSLEALNTISNAKKSLNETMVFIDKQ